MTARRELQREFADTYIRSSGNIPVYTARHNATFARSVQTIVVDTSHLTDGRQELATTWTPHASSTTTLNTAYRATAHSTSSLMQNLHRVCGDDSASTYARPAEAGSERVEWVAWHYGEKFELTIAGSVSAVLHYCNLTENEREAILLAARRLSTGNHIVFATARGLSQEAHLQANTLDFDGLVSCVLLARSGVHNSIAQLCKEGKQVVYITSEPEDIATYIGHACGIVNQPSPAHHADFTSSATHEIYAHVNRRSAHRVIETLPQPTLIAQHPLDVIVRMFASFR